MAKFKSERPANSVSDKYMVDAEVKKSAPVRNKTIAGVLAFFLGFLGIHQFYLKNIGKGILCVIITSIFAGVYFALSLVSLDMFWLIIAFSVYEAIMVIQGIVYITESEKSFKKKNKVRTF